MTKEPITENDRLIAEFMGLRIDSFPDKSDWWFVDAPNNFDSIYHNENESLFSSDYNWLMPVVEKIEKMDYGFKMCRKVVEVYIDSTKETIIKTKESCRIDSLYKAVVEFIKLHNEQKFK